MFNAKSTWNIECPECLESTNVECGTDVQPPMACPMCGHGDIDVKEDGSDED